MGELVVGANLPWIDYGLDFGANAWQPRGGLARPERRERLRRAVAALAESGATLVRLWLLADGRAGLQEEDDGARLDDRVVPDVEAAVEVLGAAGLKALVVLTDFLWFRRARRVDGVRLGGRRRLVRRPSDRARTLERVFVPIAERFGREPAIAGWDLMNEPEWATLGRGALDPRSALSPREMRGFLSDLAAVFRSLTTQPLTVGLARTRSLPLVWGLDLDVLQVHWYETLEPEAALSRPVATFAGSRPVLLGEFPTRGASVPPGEILERARQAGYWGALAWSALARDRATDALACHDALRAWGSRRPPACAVS